MPRCKPQSDAPAVASGRAALSMPHNDTGVLCCASSVVPLCGVAAHVHIARVPKCVKTAGIEMESVPRPIASRARACNSLVKLHALVALMCARDVVGLLAR